MSLIAQKLISASGATEETDDDFNLVTGLYHFDGSNGGQNDTYVDSSSTSKTLTCSSNLFQGTFSPFSADEGKWSVYFDGSSNYQPLSVATSNDIFAQTSDFTLEFFYFGDGRQQTLIDTRSGLNTDTAITIYMNSSGQVGFYAAGADRIAPSSSSVVVGGTWNHIALARSSSVTNMWINGSLAGSVSDSYDYANTNNYKIGGPASSISSYHVEGYISNYRFIKGTALYSGSGSITVPTSYLTAVTNTKLLCCQSNRYKDNSTVGSVITPSSSAYSYIQPFSPFAPSLAYDAAVNGGSAYWPTETDKTNKITLSASADFAFGTGAFTIDCWVYVTADTNPYSRVWHVGPFWNDNNAIGLVVNDTAESDKITFDVYVAGGRTCVSTNTTPMNQWTHIACVRDSSGNFKLFINGNLDATNTSYTSTDISSGGNQTFSIGNIVETSSAIEAEAQFEGYISNLRVVKGTAIYSSSFTPPTAPTTDVTNTKLLANFTNASIIDSTGKNNVETGANAQLDTTVKKFGTASYESDGSTSSFLTLSNSDMFPTGFSPFTIEGFIYINSPHKNYNNIISLGYGIQMYVDSGGKLICWLGNSSGAYFVNGLQSTATISLSTWTHIALVRNSVYPYTSNTVTWFVNGTSGGQTTEGVSNTIAPVGLYNTFATIGAYPNGSYIYDGFLDELRITNKARYTSNFTAPTKAFANR